MTKLKVKNGLLGPLLDALAELLDEKNRLVWRVAVLAAKAQRAVAAAHGPVHDAHVRILREHGATQTSFGGWTLPDSAPGYTEGNRLSLELLNDETEVELEPIPEELIEQSSKPVEISGRRLMLLLETGVVVERKPEPAAA